MRVLLASVTLGALAACYGLVGCQGNVTFEQGNGGSGGTAGAPATNNAASTNGSGGDSTSGPGSSTTATSTTTSSTTGGMGGQGGSCGDLILEAEVTHQPTDIIFVVDNSGSMNEEIAGLEVNLYSQLSVPATNAGIDHRIIMVTDHGSGSWDVCIQAPLSNTTNCSGPPLNVPDQFYHYSTNVQSHDSFCKILNTVNGNEADEFNLAPNGWSQWLRPEALKAFVELSDDGSNCFYNGTSLNDGNNIATGQQAAVDFDQALLAASPIQFGTQQARKYVFYSMIGMAPFNPNNPLEPWAPTAPVTTNECTPGAVDPGTGYQWLSKGTNALRFPLCDPSIYGAIFQTIATDLEQQTRQYCELEIPNQLIDPNGMYVLYTPSNNPNFPEPLFQVQGAAQCGPMNFYYENNLVHICPTSCDVIEADPNPQVELVIECGSY